MAKDLFSLTTPPLVVLRSLLQIRLTGKTQTYDIIHISENSFHASNNDYSVNLDFIRAS